MSDYRTEPQELSGPGSSNGNANGGVRPEQLAMVPLRFVQAALHNLRVCDCLIGTTLNGMTPEELIAGLEAARDEVIDQAPVIDQAAQDPPPQKVVAPGPKVVAPKAPPPEKAQRPVKPKGKGKGMIREALRKMVKKTGIAQMAPGPSNAPGPSHAPGGPNNAPATQGKGMQLVDAIRQALWPKHKTPRRRPTDRYGLRPNPRPVSMWWTLPKAEGEEMEMAEFVPYVVSDSAPDTDEEAMSNQKTKKVFEAKRLAKEQAKKQAEKRAENTARLPATPSSAPPASPASALPRGLKQTAPPTMGSSDEEATPPKKMAPSPPSSPSPSPSPSVIHNPKSKRRAKRRAPTSSSSAPSTPPARLARDESDWPFSPIMAPGASPPPASAAPRRPSKRPAPALLQGQGSESDEDATPPKKMAASPPSSPGPSPSPSLRQSQQATLQGPQQASTQATLQAPPQASTQASTQATLQGPLQASTQASLQGPLQGPPQATTQGPLTAADIDRWLRRHPPRAQAEPQALQPAPRPSPHKALKAGPSSRKHEAPPMTEGQALLLAKALAEALADHPALRPAHEPHNPPRTMAQAPPRGPPEAPPQNMQKTTTAKAPPNVQALRQALLRAKGLAEYQAAHEALAQAHRRNTAPRAPAPPHAAPRAPTHMAEYVRRAHIAGLHVVSQPLTHEHAQRHVREGVICRPVRRVLKKLKEKITSFFRW